MQRLRDPIPKDSKRFQRSMTMTMTLHFFWLTNVTKKNKKKHHHTASAKEHLDAQLVKEFPEIQVALQESNGLVLDESQPEKKNAAVLWDAPENHSRTKNHVESHDPKTERC